MKVFVLFAVALTLVQGCEDQSEYCADWKLSGWCEEYKDHLKESCARTCGFCGGSSGGGGSNVIAIDNRPAREPRSPDFCTDACATGACEWYKAADHCTKFSAVMVENCARTCGWCGAATCKPPVVDNGWTDFENTLVPAGAVVNVNCYEGFKSYGASTLTCNSYGEFDGSASCVKPDDSYGGGYTRETECQAAVKRAQTESFKDGEYVVPQESTHYVPQCDEYEGNYKQVQYDGGKGESFCVDTYRGIEIEGTRITGKHDYIGCTRDSAKEYYARLEAEKQAANPAPVYNEEPIYYAPEPAYEETYYEPEYNYNYEAPAEPEYDPWAYDTTSEDAWAEDSWDDAVDTWDDAADSGSYYDEQSEDDYGYYETRYYDAGADASADAVVPESEVEAVDADVLLEVKEQTLDETEDKAEAEGELFDFDGELFADAEVDTADIEDLAEVTLELEQAPSLDEILQDIIDSVDAGEDEEVSVVADSAVDMVYYADADAEAEAEEDAMVEAKVDAAEAEAKVEVEVEEKEAVPLRWKREILDDAMMAEEKEEKEEMMAEEKMEELVEELMAEDAAEPMTK